MKCTWREACKAADYVLEHFGDLKRDRGIWVWYCQRIGLCTFLDLADEIISSWNQREIRWPVRGNFSSAKIAATLRAETPVPVPIAQTPDGQVKVMTATDGGQSATFTWGHEWKIGGINMFSSEHAGVDWVLSEVAVYLPGGSCFIMNGSFAADGTLLTVDGALSPEPPEPGTYPNARISIMATKTGETQPIGLDIPITLVVEE